MNIVLRPYKLEEFERSLEIRELSEAERIDHWRGVVASSGEWVDHYLHLAIVVDALLAGDVQFRRCHWSMPPGALEVGIELGEQYRGQGIGSQTLRIIRHDFLTDDVHRISGSTDKGNIAMIRAFEKAHWSYEGTLRGLFNIEGALRDYVSYSVIRGDA